MGLLLLLLIVLLVLLLLFLVFFFFFWCCLHPMTKRRMKTTNYENCVWNLGLTFHMMIHLIAGCVAHLSDPDSTRSFWQNKIYNFTPFRKGNLLIFNMQHFNISNSLQNKAIGTVKGEMFAWNLISRFLKNCEIKFSRKCLSISSDMCSTAWPWTLIPTNI